LKLVTLLKALEFLFKERPELNFLQKQLIKRQLEQHPQKSIEKVLAHWPQWFADCSGLINPYLLIGDKLHHFKGIGSK